MSKKTAVLSRKGISASSVLALGAILSWNAVAQSKTVEPHELRTIRYQGLIALQLTTNEGKINIYLPDGLREGDAFSGTLESLGLVSSSATLDYTLELGGQHATVKDGAFHWKLPAKTDGHMRLRFADRKGNELAVTELPILRASDAKREPLPGADQLHLPAMVQAGAGVPLFGPLDGDSSTTSVEIGGEQLRILAELPGKAIAEGPEKQLGVTPYVVKKGSLQAQGKARVIKIDQSLPPIAQQNGKLGKWHVRITGLAGVRENVPLKFEIALPQTGFFEPTPPYEYFISETQYRFVLPKEVRKDGSFATERTIMRLVEGRLNASATLVIPQDLHELVDMVLRTPRENYSKMPEQEHAEALKPYGENVKPVLADFLADPNMSYEAVNVLSLAEERGARWVIPRLTEMSGQPLDGSLRIYSDMALQDPAFPYKKELRAATLKLVAQIQLPAAIYALGKTGSAEDIPLLEAVYRGAQGGANRFAEEASQAALARLGVKEHIDNLAKKIITPGNFWSQDVGRAVYADRPELIPALCQHIHDQAHWYGDYGVDPAGEAINAIIAIKHKQIKEGEVAAVCEVSLP